jgi:hypothetical protein
MANYYTSALAGGGGTGTIGSPFTFAEALTFIVAGAFAAGDTMYYKADGTYTTAFYTITKAGTANATCKMEGYTTTPGDGGMVTFQRTSGAGIFVTNQGIYWVFKNIIFDAANGGTNVVSMVGTHFYINCTFTRGGAGGANGAAVLINCKANNNATYGIGTAEANFCISINNGTTGFLSNTVSYKCIAANNGGYGYSIVANNSIVDCIANNNSGGGIITAGGQMMGIINNIISNNAGGYGINFVYTGESFAYNNNFYNNGVDTNQPTFLINKKTFDPQFNNTATFDFRRTGTNLNGQGFSDVGMYGFNYETSIGVMPGKIGTGVLPTFAGITSLSAGADGTLLASWSAGTAVDFYQIYIQAVTATGLFVAGNIVSSVTGTSKIIKTDATGTTLLTAQVYYVGVRSINTLGGETNSVSLSATPVLTTSAGIWDYLTSAITTSGSIGKLLKDDIDTTISSRATQTSVNTIDTKIGTPVVSVSTDIANEPFENWNIDMSPFTIVNTAGWYQAIFGTSGLLPSDIVNIKNAIWQELLTSQTTSGSFGVAVKNMSTDTIIIKGLVQNNFRILSPSYDASNNLTTATIKIYPTATDTNNDTNSIASFALSATYDVNNNMATYKVTLI